MRHIEPVQIPLAYHLLDHPLVLEQGAHKQLARLLVVGEKGEQPLLLLAEVPDRLAREEAEEARGRATAFLVGGVGRTAQPARLDEGVMVIVRERDEGRVAPHRFGQRMERSDEGSTLCRFPCKNAVKPLAGRARHTVLEGLPG
jgi:hypothetical protein